MIYGYIRVSTDTQTIENQRFEIENYCNRNNLKVDKWIEETISGTVTFKKRKFNKILNRAVQGDIIIATEISRLGRKLLEIMTILNICLSNDISVYTIKDNFKLDSGIQSKILAFAFGLSAEIERNLISQRTKEALARKKAEGVILGRPKGRKSKKLKLDYKRMLVEKLWKEGKSKTEIARQTKTHRITVANFIKEKIII